MKSLVGLSLFVTLATGCGSSSKTSSDSQPLENENRESIDIPISLTSDQLNLAVSASAFTLSLAGCASGLTGTATEATPSFKVYKADTSCFAKLTSLTVAGQNYALSNPSAVAFSSNAADATATFTDSTGTRKINVIIVNQLSSPLLASDTIRYSFSIIQADASGAVADSDLAEGHSIAVSGDVLPNYKIDKINFQGLNASGGGRFTFQTECLEAVVAGATPSCSTLLFTNTSYVLAKDIYSGAPTAVQLAALFPGTAVLANQLVTNTTGNLGGFITAILDGPNQIALNPKMILVLKNGNSYQYFLITAQAI